MINLASFSISSRSAAEGKRHMADFALQERLSRLQAEALLLVRQYPSVRFDRQDGAWVQVASVPVGPGWNKPAVDVMVDIPTGTPGYPRVPPSWFWTDHDLVPRDGRPVGHFFTGGQGFLVDQHHADRGWGHFCIHPHACTLLRLLRSRGE